jgi:predicted permease
MIEILNIVSPVFIVIGVGYALGRMGLLSEETNSKFSWFVFYVSAPALLFLSAARTPVSEALNLNLLGSVYLVSVVMFAIVYLAGARLDPSRRGVICQGSFRSNMVFVGLPVITNAFGDEVLGPASVLIGLTVPLYNLLAVLALTMPHNQGADNAPAWGGIFRSTALNPLILGSLAGILFSALHLGLPSPAERSIELLARIAMPLALVCVGASLDLRKLRVEIGPSLLVSLLKLIIYPAMAFAVLTLLGESGTGLKFTVLIMAAPTAIASHIMAVEMKGDPKLSASVVIGATIFSMFTITGWLALFKWLG